MKRFPIPFSNLAVAVALVGFLGFAGTALWLINAAVDRAFLPRYQYLEDTIVLGATGGCPGGTVPFFVDIDVAEPNAAFLIGENWTNKATGEIYEPPMEPRLVDAAGINRSGSGANVPIDAPPGEYWYERGAITTRSDVLSMTLTVLPPEQCGAQP